MPRNFGTPGFDSLYPARPIGTLLVVTSGPIGPPQKTNSNPPPPSMLAPGSGRRQSIADPGPIGPPRPIQPIARPTEPSGSGSASPVRRSPSPKVLGSSALATDDDEVLSTSRRTVVNGPVWGAAPASPDSRVPWNLHRLDSLFNLPTPPPPPGLPLDNFLGELQVRTISGTQTTTPADSSDILLSLPPTLETRAITIASRRLFRTFCFLVLLPQFYFPAISPFPSTHPSVHFGHLPHHSLQFPSFPLLISFWFTHNHAHTPPHTRQVITPF